MPLSEQLNGAVQAVLTSFEDTDEDSTDTEEHRSQLHQLLLALWRTQWEATGDHTIHDPTMCFLALYSLEKTGKFAGPKKTTGPIAKLCWGIKLCMLKEIHELVESGRCKNQLEAFSMIALFVIEHELTTFHHLRSLTHYAMTLVYMTMEAPSIIWTDRETWREMLDLGERILLEQLQKVLAQLEEQIFDLWEDKIMLNTELHVKYGDLSDNLANTNPGYSFITNPLNPFAAHRHSFIKAVQKKPDLAEYFVYEASGVADIQLNMHYSRGWLCDLAEFEGLVMLYTEFTPGALICWTEFKHPSAYPFNTTQVLT
jgi:bloom syndrome protein